MAVNLTPAQKDEIRRLTQFSNRRILAVAREYKYAGKDVLPRELVGDYQIKEKWHATKTPISRSVKFDSMQDYRRQLNKLRAFEVQRDDIWTYTRVQKEKTLQAVESALGIEAPQELQDKINNLSAPKLADFWVNFSNKSARMGTKYSSNSAMQSAMEDYFKEDIDSLTKTK